MFHKLVGSPAWRSEWKKTVKLSPSSVEGWHRGLVTSVMGVGVEVMLVCHLCFIPCFFGPCCNAKLSYYSS